MKVAVIVNKTTRELVSVIEPVYVGKGPRFFCVDKNYEAFEMQLETLISSGYLEHTTIPCMYNIDRESLLSFVIEPNSGETFEEMMDNWSEVEREA